MRADGAPSSGLVTLTPVVTRDSAALNLTVVAAPVVVALDSAGKFARTVIAGNDPELGALLYLKIDELIDGESRPYTILVPESAAEAGLDLADRESLEPVQEMAGYVLLSSIGVTVAPLVNNLVPVVHLPTASGGGVTDHGLLSGLADDDHPNYLTQVRGDARYYTETELDFLFTGKAATGHAHSYQPLDSDLTDIAALAPADGPVLRRVLGAWAAATLVKGDFGLGNVDNTSDADKSVSSAQQAALDGKQPFDSDLATIAALAPADDSLVQRKAGIWADRTPAQVKVDLVLVRGDVALGNVDNTSDATKPISATQQAALDLKVPLSAPLSFPNALIVGEEAYSRERVDSSTGIVNTQAMRLTYFTARKAQTTTRVRVRSGTTAAGATPTLCRVGLYLIDGAGDGTRVASILNDTSLFNLASTGFTRDWSVPYVMIVGQRYALGILVVTTAATPTIVGYTYATSMDEEGAVAPRLTGRLNTQTDLPVSFTDASLSLTINRYYGVILPA